MPSSVEPAIGITVTTVRSEIRSWANKEHLKHWQAAPACRQAKSLIHGPDRQLTRSALGLRRCELKVLVGLLTGHTTLNRHLCVMKLRKDPLCSACGEEEETAFHFLGTRSTRMQHKYSTFGSYLLEFDELSKVNPLSLIRFVRTTKRLL